MLNVGLVLEQQMDDIAMALPTGKGQRDVVLTPRGNIDPCTMEEKKLGYREMAFPEWRKIKGREKQGRQKARESKREGQRERERERERG